MTRGRTAMVHLGCERPRRRHRYASIAFVALVVATAGASSCSDESATDSSVDAGAAPSDMCPSGEYPILAAYALDDGSPRWVTCDSGRNMHVAVAATADDVWVEVPYPAEVIRISARTGEIIERLGGTMESAVGEDLSAGADRIRRTPPGSATVEVRGGQDDPLVGIDRRTGEERWRAVGSPVYDDVWAGDDEAVYVWSADPTVSDPGPWISARLIDTGEERWRLDARNLGYPWHVSGDRLFAMWFDIHTIDTADGSVVWRTSYGEPEGGFPRMFGAVADGDMVFVSFTSVESGGD